MRMLRQLQLEFGVTSGGLTFVLLLPFSGAALVLFCGGMEGEYAMGEGLDSLAAEHERCTAADLRARCQILV